MKYIVVEGSHRDPNNRHTLDLATKKVHGPYETEKEASEVAQALIQKNVDDYQHRAWVETHHHQDLRRINTAS